MDRRTFLKGGAAAGAFGALHLASGRFSPVFGGTLGSTGGVAAPPDNGRILVILRLDGGNDGLNTVLPLDQYDNLAKARGNILIPAGKALALDHATGLHPAMAGLANAFQDGELRIVQAVGYPNHNQSHFRSTDIWFTGSDSNEVLGSGVMGRYLDGQFPNFPEGYPNALHPHPPAVQIGSTLFTLLQGDDAGLGMAISDPSRVYSLQSDGIDVAPATPAGHELEFIRQMASQTRKYGDAVKAAMAAATTRSALYPASGNRLADQFKAVARLIAGGLQTRVYVLSIGGFDTHSDQVSGADTATGKHADLLGQVSVAITAFLDDLRLLGLADRVVGATMSEFGRRILSNASLGTDHGMAAPLLLFGKPVAGGILGTNPPIPATVTSRDNVAMQFDFRSVYASLLRDWLQLGMDEVDRVMGRRFEGIPLIDKAYMPNGGRRVEFHLQPVRFDASRRSALFDYSLDHDAVVTLQVFDLHGRMVRTILESTVSAGDHSAAFDLSTLGPGQYALRMVVEGSRISRGFQSFR